jgi:ribonuclease Y
MERLETLENLVKKEEWIKKAYILQAGREIWAFVDEDKIDDLKIYEISKKIKKKIEQNLDYPWIIKIIVIRENKAISYIW